MSKFTSFARRCATGFVAAQLMFGAVSVTAVTAAAPVQAATYLDYHGAWQGFSTTIDGQRLFGAITHMDDGSTTAFLAKDGGLALIMINPAWHLADGASVPIVLTIDGTAYTMVGVARGAHTIEMARVKQEVLAMFAGGAQAELNVNDGALVWTIDLHGFTAAISDALKLVRA